MTDSTEFKRLAYEVGLAITEVPNSEAILLVKQILTTLASASEVEPVKYSIDPHSGQQDITEEAYDWQRNGRLRLVLRVKELEAELDRVHMQIQSAP